jgi:hypothetical protein
MTKGKGQSNFAKEKGKELKIGQLHYSGKEMN